MFLSAISHFFHLPWHVHLPAWLMLVAGAVLHVIGAVPTLLISLVFGLIGAVTFPSAAGVASYLVTVGGSVAFVYGLYIKERAAGFKKMEEVMKGSLTEQVEGLKKQNAEQEAQIKTVRSLALEKEAQIRELTGQVRELMMHQSRMVEALIDKDASHISEHPIQAIKQVAQIVREQGQIALEASHSELNVLPLPEPDKPKTSQEPEKQP